MGRLKLFGAVLSAMQIDPTRPHRDRLPRSRDGARRRRHLRGHRRADQPAADGQGDPGGRLLQADRGRRVPRQHAVERRHRHRRRRQGVRRRRPQERRRLHRHGRDRRAAEDCSSRRSSERRTRMDGLLVVDKPAGSDLPRRRRARAARARRAAHRPHRHARSARPPACCRWCSGGRRGWRNS